MQVSTTNDSVSVPPYDLPASLTVSRLAELFKPNLDTPFILNVNLMLNILLQEILDYCISQPRLSVNAVSSLPGYKLRLLDPQLSTCFQMPVRVCYGFIHGEAMGIAL